MNHYPELCCVSQGDLTTAALPGICGIQVKGFLFKCSSLLHLVPMQRVYSVFTNAVAICTGCPFSPKFTIFQDKSSGLFSHKQFY